MAGRVPAGVWETIRATQQQGRRRPAATSSPTKVGFEAAERPAGGSENSSPRRAIVDSPPGLATAGPLGDVVVADLTSTLVVQVGLPELRRILYLILGTGHVDLLLVGVDALDHAGRED